RREPAGPEEAGLRVLEEPRPGRTLSSVQTGLRAGRACAVDEAYDEYCKLLEAGARPDPDRFCERFPHCKTSLQRVLQLHCFIEGRPELLADSDLENAPEAGQEFLGFSVVKEAGRGWFAPSLLAAAPDLREPRVIRKVHQAGRAGRA